MVDCDMKFDATVGIAEKIQTTSKPGGTHSVPPLRKPNPDKQWSPGKPMQFPISDCKAPYNIEAATKKGAPYPGAKNSINLVHFPNTKPDKTNYKQYGTTIDKEKEQLAKEGKCFFCKHSVHLARDCDKKKICNGTIQLRYEPGHKIKSARVVIAHKKTSSVHVAKSLPDKRMHTLLLCNTIWNVAEIRINVASANVLIDPCTVGADRISEQFCHLHNMPTEEMPTKSSFIAINESKSTITKGATMKVNVQGHKENGTFLVSNLMDWDAIIGHRMLHHLNTVMTVEDNRVTIQPTGKMRYYFNMVDRVTDTPVMQAAATFTEGLDSSYVLPLSYDSSSHAYETETDEDTTDSSASDSEEEPASSHHTPDSDSQGRPKEQQYQMLDASPTLHPCLDCNSAEDMITQAQPHW